MHSTSDPVPRHLFIISRETPYLAEYMREQFSEEPSVEVFIDRRRRQRRAAASAVQPDRRSTDRRERRDVDRELRESFHAFVTLD
jgi:hypothetical protein